MHETRPNAFDVSEESTRITITLGENVRHDDAPDLLAVMKASLDAHRSIVIDCGRSLFLSTSVTQLFLSLRRTCREAGVSFEIKAVQESVAAYYRLAGLSVPLDN